MRRLVDVVMDLGIGRERGVIHAAKPWVPESEAAVHDPWSVLSPPEHLVPFLDADLAHEYLRAWSSWQSTPPTPGLAVVALVEFAGRPAVAMRERLQLPVVRASTHSGRDYIDPDDDLTFELLTQVVAGAELFVLFERIEDPTSQSYVQVARYAEGELLVEQRAGAEATHRSGSIRQLPQLAESIRRWRASARPDFQIPGLAHGFSATT